MQPPLLPLIMYPAHTAGVIILESKLDHASPMPKPFSGVLSPLEWHPNSSPRLETVYEPALLMPLSPHAYSLAFTFALPSAYNALCHDLGVSGSSLFMCIFCPCSNVSIIGINPSLCHFLSLCFWICWITLIAQTTLLFSPKKSIWLIFSKFLPWVKKNTIT